MADLGRLSSIERTAKLISVLLSGREITRADVTALLGVRVAAVSRVVVLRIRRKFGSDAVQHHTHDIAISKLTPCSAGCVSRRAVRADNQQNTITMVGQYGGV